VNFIVEAVWYSLLTFIPYADRRVFCGFWSDEEPAWLNIKRRRRER
jgi:hypothetical protein